MNCKKIFLTILLVVFYFVFTGYSQVEEPVKWKFSVENAEEDFANLIFEVSIEDKWHLYSQYFEMGGAMPMLFTFTDSENYSLVDYVAEFPEPIEEYDEVFEQNVKYFKKSAKFVQKVKILNDKGFNINGNYDGQACYDGGMCVQIVGDFSFPVNGGELAAKPLDTNAESVAAKTPVIVTENQFSDSGKDDSIFKILLLGLFFGFISIFTPCVFPMIPMTLSVFMQGGDNKFGNLLKVLFFGLSIVILYTLFGLVVSLTGAGANFATVLSSHWIPNIIFFLLFAAFAASLFGLFEIVLPTGLANKADRQVDKGGMLSSFFLAVTLVIVSFSCTGPFIGTIVVEAVRGHFMEPTIGMLGFGLGFGIPFTLLALFPSLLKKLPKSGGWLNAVKVVMAFILLAFSLKFLSNIDQNYHLGFLNRDIYLAIWIVLAILLGIYLLGKIKFSHDSEIKHISFFRLLLVTASFVFAVYLIPGLFGANLSPIAGLLPPKTSQKFDLTMAGSSISGGKNSLCGDPNYSDVLHMPYNIQGYFDWKQGLECAKSQDKPILLYFTGHTCSNCKVMQAEVWSNDKVQEYFNDKLVLTALYVDEKTVTVPAEDMFTSSNDGKVKKKLGEINSDIQVVNFNKNSQPYYVLMSPDGKVLVEPMVFNSNPEDFIKFLEEGFREFEK